MKYNFPKIKISKDEKIWLTKVYEKFLLGQEINRSIIRVELHQKISKQFDASRIDTRLLENYETITLLGIYHVDPNSELIENIDKTLHYIKSLIITSPDKVSDVTSKEVSEKLKIPRNQSDLVFQLLKGLGGYRKLGGVRVIEGEKTPYVSVDEYSVFEEYLKYDGIESVVNNLYRKNHSKHIEEFPLTKGKKKRTKPKANASPKIFISHASKDKKLIDEFVNQILFLGLKVKEDDVFYTSLEGLDIQTGEDFRDYIKEKLQDTRIVILIITPNYRESEMCLNEMGAAWALDRKVVPIIVEPINYESVGVLMKVKQIGKLNDSAFLDKFKDNEIEKLKLNFEKIKTARWSKIKADFIDYVNQYSAQVQDEVPKIQLSQADIISKIKQYFQINNLLWARLIYELGSARFQWSTEPTLIKRTGIDQHHINEFAHSKPEIVKRSKGKSGFVIYRLTESAKETFFKVIKSFPSGQNFEGRFINQNDPPLLEPKKELNDHYFNNKNPIDLSKFDIELSIKPIDDYWRCGVRFSKNEVFQKARHDVFPFYGVHKDKTFNGYRVFYYNENNSMTVLTSSEDENRWITIQIKTEHNKTLLKVFGLENSTKEISDYKYCQILAWADEDAFEMEYKIKLIWKN